MLACGAVGVGVITRKRSNLSPSLIKLVQTSPRKQSTYKVSCVSSFPSVLSYSFHYPHFRAFVTLNRGLFKAWESIAPSQSYLLIVAQLGNCLPRLILIS